jgi:hypothetical protein
MAESTGLLLEEELAAGRIAGGGSGIGRLQGRNKNAASEKPGGKREEGGTHGRRNEDEGKGGSRRSNEVSQTNESV